MRAVTFVLLLGALPAQSWSVTPFGSGCWDLQPAWNPNPVTTTSGQATPGFTLILNYGGPTAYNAGTGPVFYEYRPALILGLSNQVTSGVPLPWTLPAVLTRAPCQLLVSADVIEFMNPVNPASYASSFALPIPNNPQLIGLTFFAQWSVFNNTFPILPILGPPGTVISTSEALAITIGL